MRPKPKTYRNTALLRAANEAPCCMGCGAPNLGNVVAAHSNQSRDGKGMSIKAHDYRIAYLCDVCHREVDQGMGSRAERIERWEDAHRKTIGWLFESGRLNLT